MPNDDILRIEDDSDDLHANADAGCWKLLIVDDEPDVHSSTILAIGRETICGRRLRFLHCHSCAEAKALLTTNADIAVILLDVVMESERAGLELIEYVRDELEMTDTRIVLRTGQPGYAPELDVIRRYEINDYKSKSELTRNKLYTTITSAIRSYAQIRALQMSKRGLEAILNASKGLICLREYDEFVSGIITQLAAFFSVPEEGVVCVRKHTDARSKDSHFRVVAAAGRFRHFINQPVAELSNPAIVEAIEQAAANRLHQLSPDYTCLFFESPQLGEMIVYLAAGPHDEGQSSQLLELFSTNIAVCIDNVSALNELHLAAYNDGLLRIPNRQAFLVEVERHLAQGTNQSMVVLIDIDEFAALNDTIGSEQGDRLLMAVRDRLAQQLPYALMIARIAGDTFGVLVETDRVDLDALDHLFLAPFDLGEQSYMLSATQGRVTIEDQAAATEVVAQANTALKRAKHSVRGGHLGFSAELLDDTERRVQLLQRLRRGHEANQLSLAYQPKIRLKSRQVCGFEALMRWRTGDGEQIEPLEFIPVAEASGMIVVLGEWAIQEALKTACELNTNSQQLMPIAVNVSAVQFRHPGFVELIDRALEQTGADPSWLELEITESVPMHDLDMVRALMSHLSERGIRFSIDDFGTGFSSLSYLEQLEIHSLKIDRHFIANLEKQPPQTRMPETILRLAQVLDLEVVAEGVETEAQAQWLEQAGCDIGQGYLYARPLASNQLMSWLSDWAEK
ncbi:MAG: diguanylate cyclase [Lysobacteraceae bacterium]|nr:MAG: diguanylate cyclase [Xanthomonadaceae bacterium]